MDEQRIANGICRIHVPGDCDGNSPSCSDGTRKDAENAVFPAAARGLAPCKCDPGTLVYTSDPLQYRCIRCGQWWHENQTIPDCKAQRRNPFSEYTREEMNSILRTERETGAMFERERCAKIADAASAEVSNAPHALACKNDWHGNTRTKCGCFKGKVISQLAKIRSGE